MVTFPNNLIHISDILYFYYYDKVSLIVLAVKRDNNIYDIKRIKVGISSKQKFIGI